MRILVMGAGAVGGYLGGVLSKSGQDVVLVARGAHLDAINSRGLQIQSDTAGSFVVHPPVMEAPDGSNMADLVLFCVKSYQNEQAIDKIGPAVGEGTTILTLQNGIGGVEMLTEAFGQARVMPGAVYIEAMRKGLGTVVQVGAPCRVVFGEMDGQSTGRSLKIRDALRDAGIDVHLSADVSKERWNKLIFICTLSGMTCVTRALFADVVDTPGSLDLAWRVIREIVAVGSASGIDLDGGIAESTMSHLQESKDDLISSMYLDLEAGNPLEIAALNGAVSRMGSELGVATPVNDFIAGCLSVADERARSRLG